eukprot:418519-Prymnesium_polylepis.2
MACSAARGVLPGDPADRKRRGSARARVTRREVMVARRARVDGKALCRGSDGKAHGGSRGTIGVARVTWSHGVVTRVTWGGSRGVTWRAWLERIAPWLGLECGLLDPRQAR